MTIRKIAIITAGGDGPGMNEAIPQLRTRLFKDTIVISFFIFYFSFSFLAFAAGENFVVELKNTDNQVVLLNEQKEKFVKMVVDLVETSNFNSFGRGSEYFNKEEVEELYSSVLLGRHLVVTFAEPTVIHTTGGDLEITEIVLDLRRDDYVRGVLTKGPDGQIAGHGKYDGGICVEIMEYVKQILTTKNK